MATPAIFSLLVVVRLICAKYSIIPDCDEVFNYWEPTHFLTHGYGLQTWEYSPSYAIRSWAYVGIHGLVIKAVQLAGIKSKHVLFFALRSGLATVCALSEAKLFSTLQRHISRRVALFYVIFSAVSTGMFHASVSYLPSSFAMYMFTFALSYFLDRSDSMGFVKGLTFTAIGGILGWPFALAMVLPFGLQYVVSTLYRARWSALLKSAVLSMLAVTSTSVVVISIDSVFYRQLQVVPYNIVAYNVLNSSDQTGPDIFGTEPWHFYLVNLAMNFNLVFALTLIAPVLPLINWVSPFVRISNLSFLALLSPFFLWLAIFTVQPHKEERFMYVGYSSLCLNAALALEGFSVLAQCLASALGLLSLFNRRSLVIGVLLATALVSLLRSAALVTYYGAPINVMLHTPDRAGNVCIGREWYRFPSSYFLHQNQRLKFIKSGFSGLLPGEFIESENVWWERNGTWVQPMGMNNQNQEDLTKYVSVDSCDYVVDTSAPVDTESGEILFTEDLSYGKVYCLPFLNSAESRGIGRVLWLPQFLHSYTKTSLSWDDYCILQHH